MKTEFEKGREYERQISDRRSYLFTGWVITIFSFVSLIGIFLTKTLPWWIFPILFLIGIGNIWVVYSKEKKLR